MRNRYKELRNEFVTSLKRDLIGPYNDDEIINESPTSSYIMGRLSPIDENVNIYKEDDNLLSSIESVNEINPINQEPHFNDIDENNEEDSDANEILNLSRNKQSSAGLKVYLAEKTQSIIVKVNWADYVQSEVEINNSRRNRYKRTPKYFRKEINITKSNLEGEPLENGIYLVWLTYKLTNKNRMVSVFVENRRTGEKESNQKNIFQVQLNLEAKDDENYFLSESLAYEKDEADDYFYYKKPIFSRGYGCGATWGGVIGHTTKYIETDFLPGKEVSGMDAELKQFKNHFSMLHFSVLENRDVTLSNLTDLLDDYDVWIQRLSKHEYMQNSNYIEIGSERIEHCKENLRRMREGLDLLHTNDEAFKAFLFMNNSVHLSRSMGEYSKYIGEGKSLEDFTYDHSYWRPFQIGFILLNIKSIVIPESDDRKILDLLYFPTGGGKTEAYLGVISFLIAYRRITRFKSNDYEKDGGVTVIVRYTLRLLTTQQRDRMLRLISACELIRKKNPDLFGEKEYSIGFWVGSTVTVNNYSDLQESQYNNAYQVKSKKSNLDSQILKCPCCGETLTNDSYLLNVDNKEYHINCPNKLCDFHQFSIPVYLIDEDIYRKTPTIVIGTVDKFARITFEERSYKIFGRRDFECNQCGSIFKGEKNTNCLEEKHVIQTVKQFYPPELILQDELHLITGPLGTIYGGYEMAVDELAKVQVHESEIKPKYIASTATVKNAEKQIISLYGRENHNQFPPKGHDSDDAYFAREKNLESYPFRLYVGISSPFTSMKTTLTRVYAILLQTAFRYKDDPEMKEFLDPYWTLIGYYNSKRELGGAVRLIQDDIPARIGILQNKNNDKQARRYLNHSEITSRTKSRDIPRVLSTLENSFTGNGYVYDIVVATNMIQVGMDVERLGLMAVTGQPKTTAEYIQATSRVGRNNPGLVITVYNAYRARDISHYENFTAYHSHLYRYVEGNSATPFSARARERTLHAAFIAMIRGKYELLRDIKIGVRKIEDLSDDDIKTIFNLVKQRITLIDPNNTSKTMDELKYFYDEWIRLARLYKNLYYYVGYSNPGYKNKKIQRLLKTYGEYGQAYEKDTLNSMRNVQKQVGLHLWEV